MNVELAIANIIILIFSVIAHEVAHGYMALYQGDQTAKLMGRLSLNPIRHLDPIGSFVVPLFTILLGGTMFGWAKPVPYNPYNLRNQRWGEAYVALAGPLTNLLIAITFGIIIKFAGGGINLSGIEIMTYIVDINIVLAVFNLCPIPPLDGFKIFKSIFQGHKHSKLIYLIEKNSLIVLVIFIFFLWQLFEPLIGILHNIIL
jgi:Zn-dependent protease